jgi:copper chaperone CopZ
MTSRRCVREVSAWISDVPGVRTVEARLDTVTVHVTGTAEPDAIEAAIRQAGYTATALPEGTPGGQHTGDSAADHEAQRGGPVTSPAISTPDQRVQQLHQMR